MIGYPCLEFRGVILAWHIIHRIIAVTLDVIREVRIDREKSRTRD